MDEAKMTTRFRRREAQEIEVWFPGPLPTSKAEVESLFDSAPRGVRLSCRCNGGTGAPEALEVWNEKQGSWIQVNEGDAIRVDLAPEDAYPIARGYLDANFEKVNP